MTLTQLSLFEPEMSVAEHAAIIRDFLSRYSGTTTDTATPRPQRCICAHPLVFEDDVDERTPLLAMRPREWLKRPPLG